VSKAPFVLQIVGQKGGKTEALIQRTVDAIRAAMPSEVIVRGELDLAWAEAIALAAEKGWRVDRIEWGGDEGDDGPLRDVWTASAYNLNGPIGRIDAEGPTPAAALRALTAKLKESR
jgi:hypothetical protein